MAPPGLSLGIVVSGVATGLEQTLSSAAALADEIVIAAARPALPVARDLGRRFDARLVGPRGAADAAAGRNRLLQAARGDWVLLLESGERLVAGEQTLTAPALAAEPCLGLYLPVDPGPRAADPCLWPLYQLRLLRRTPRPHFAGRCCPWPVQRAWQPPSPRVRPSGARVLAPAAAWSPRPGAGHPLCSGHPGPWQQYWRGQALLAGADWEAAAVALATARQQLPPQSPFGALAAASQAFCLGRLGRWAEAAELLERAVLGHREAVELWLQLAVARQATGDVRGALSAYAYAGDLGDGAWPYRAAGRLPGRCRALAAMGRLHRWLGDYAAADRCFDAARQAAPAAVRRRKAYTLTRFDGNRRRRRTADQAALARLALRHGRYRLALFCLNAVAEPLPPALLALRTLAVAGSAQWPQALALLRAAMLRGLPAPTIAADLAQLLIAAGESFAPLRQTQPDSGRRSAPWPGRL